MRAAPPALLPFPGERELAQAYFREAARHLGDARVLYVRHRHAASLTSTMKAVELGLKSVLILHGAGRWLNDALESHNVLAKLKGSSSTTQSLLDALTGYDATLLSDIELLEKLTPVKQDAKKLEFEVAANTEYPFFAFLPGSLHGQTPSLYTPGTHFSGSESRQHFQTAYRLLKALPLLSPEMKGWKIPLCRPL